MLAYQRGDSLAFEVLYMRYKDSIFAFVYRQCSHAAIAEELAHDAWVSIIDRIQHYHSSAKFKTYLYQVAHNKLVDHWRRQAVAASNTASTWQDTSVDQDTIPIDGPSQHPLEQHQLQQCIHQALSRLPQEQRDAFLLREEGFSREAIADITGASKETVKSRLRYATDRLRNLLGGING